MASDSAVPSLKSTTIVTPYFKKFGKAKVEASASTFVSIKPGRRVHTVPSTNACSFEWWVMMFPRLAVKLSFVWIVISHRTQTFWMEMIAMVYISSTQLFLSSRPFSAIASESRLWKDSIFFPSIYECLFI